VITFEIPVSELSMTYKSNIHCCVPCCTQKGSGTVVLEGNQVDFLVSQSKGPKSSTKMASENTARCWPAFQTHRGYKGMLLAFSLK